MNPQKLQKLNDAAAKFETKPEPKVGGGSKIQNSPSKMEMEFEEEEKVPELNNQKMSKANSTNTGSAAKAQPKTMQKSATQKTLNNTASSESNLAKSSGNAQAGKKPATKVPITKLSILSTSKKYNSAISHFFYYYRHIFKAINQKANK